MNHRIIFDNVTNKSSVYYYNLKGSSPFQIQFERLHPVFADGEIIMRGKSSHRKHLDVFRKFSSLPEAETYLQERIKSGCLRIIPNKPKKEGEA